MSGRPLWLFASQNSHNLCRQTLSALELRITHVPLTSQAQTVFHDTLTHADKVQSVDHILALQEVR